MNCMILSLYLREPDDKVATIVAGQTWAQEYA
jgi:hypothetical protein